MERAGLFQGIWEHGKPVLSGAGQGSLMSVLNTDTVGGFDFGRQLRFCTWQVEWLKCSQNANLENKPQTFLHMALDTAYSLCCLFVSKNT